VTTAITIIKVSACLLQVGAMVAALWFVLHIRKQS
jgi:hypothetical protein